MASHTCIFFFFIFYAATTSFTKMIMLAVNNTRTGNE